MPYDDTRFSHWDDPDDDPDDESDSDGMSLLLQGYRALLDGKQDEFADRIKAMFTEHDCKMCGKGRSLNNEGYCSSCWQIWNS